MRFAIWITGDPSAYTLKKYGTYGDLFLKMLARPEDRWDVFDVQREAYPSPGEIYDGVVITGSAATAHESEPWIEDLNGKVREAFRDGVKILGVCFGHQAVANALGGRSTVNPAGWEVGLHRLELAPGFFDLRWARGIGPNLRILQIHRDHVLEPPPGAVVHARTDKTPVQVYSLGERVFCMQGHPEFFNDIVDNLARERRESGVISAALAQECENSLEDEADRENLALLLRRFLYEETSA